MRLPSAVLALSLAGCLQPTHRIPRDELMRLASLPPAARGERVHVVQDLVGDEPPPATPVTDETVIVIVPEDSDGYPPARPVPHPVPHPSGGKGTGVPSGTGNAASKADDAWAYFVLAATAAVVLAVV